VDEAVQTLAAHPAQILSGGTDFFPALGDRPAPASIIDISALSELKGIHTERDCIRIGGLTTWSELLRTPLPRSFNGLKAAAREIGGIQIQNRGTVAGNLCNASPAADSVPPFLTLDAEVELVSTAGVRRMPTANFITGNRKTLRRPDEILSQIIVPRTVDDAASVFLKLGARKYLVISIAMVAVLIKVDSARRVSDARVAVGSCSVAAKRLSDLERQLVGKQINSSLADLVSENHLRPLSPITDVRATSEYRHDAALTLVRRAIQECAETC
jgi:CO/xanthine dehydrogenase FAD-binding subunit